MQITGTVTAVEFDVQIAKKDGGQYTGARLTYSDSTGKSGVQAFHNNVLKYNAELKTQLGNLVSGSGFVMEKVKDGDFWKVVSVLPNVNLVEVSPQGSSVKATPTPKSTYETAEERAAKQVYIVRQSSISSAIALNNNAKATPTDIIKTAKVFEDYVFGNSPKKDSDFQGDEADVFDVD